MLRVCKKCGVEKELPAFTKGSKCMYGYTHECKECRNSKVRTEAVRERDRKRYGRRFIYCMQCETCLGFFKAIRKSRRYCTQYCAGMAKKGIGRPEETIRVMKKTWIQKGQRLSPETEFKFTGGPRAARDELRDGYVRSLLRDNCPRLKYKDIPQPLVDLKREEIKIKRLLREKNL